MPNLPAGPIVQALQTLLHHPDDAVRRAAAARLERFRAVQKGMSDGTLAIGSREPVANTPAWVTLEVVTGGFATGRLLAEQPDALTVNLAGLDGSRWDALVDGAYHVELPEHGAIPVVVWLLHRGHVAEAVRLLDALGPWLDRLRFVPDAAPPSAESSTAHVRTAAQVATSLRKRAPQPHVAAMNRALSVWRPLQDELAGLLGRTVVDGVVGASVPTGWWDDAAAVLRVADAALAAHREDRRPRDVRTPLGRMLSALRAAYPTRDAALLGPASHGLRQHVASRGAPGSEALAERSRDEREHAGRPLHHALDHILAERLSELPAGQGLHEPEALLSDVRPAEARPGAPAGAPMHRFAAGRLQACREGSLHTLVSEGIIGSAEQLATVAPQVTAAVRASRFEDPVLRTLVGRIDQAFRRRRGLLLLNLQHQVRLEELPWIQALQPFATELSSEQVARATASQLTTMAFAGFPYTQLPNPMIEELRSLLAVDEVTLVEEIAADIFMGRFTKKFLDSAITTAQTLHGSLYARYFDLPHPSVLAAIPVQGREVPGYAALCEARLAERPVAVDPQTLVTHWATAVLWRQKHAPFLDRQDPRLGHQVLGLPHPDDRFYRLGDQVLHADEIIDLRRAYFASSGRSVARNGALLEQNLVLTSHNVMPLLDGLGLTERVASLTPAWADDTFAWLARRMTTVPQLKGIEQLRAVKNAAYAWRQLVLWLSLTPNGAADFIARTDPSTAGPAFEPVWQGLVAVAAGESFVHGRVSGGRRFYGWSPGAPHWITQPPDA